MICKKYSAQFKTEKVQEYLEECKTKKVSKAEFAARNGISDSTFNDWVIKYQREGKGFCNITKEIIKLEPEVVDTEQYLIRQLPDEITNNLENKLDENYVRLYYNGAVIEFSNQILEKVMRILKEW